MCIASRGMEVVWATPSIGLRMSVIERIGGMGGVAGCEGRGAVDVSDVASVSIFVLESLGVVGGGEFVSVDEVVEAL